MVAKKGNSPVFTDKEENMTIAIFKNKNENGTTYPMIQIKKITYPFKYNQNLNITPDDLERVKKLIERLPKIEVQQDKKKGGEHG